MPGNHIDTVTFDLWNTLIAHDRYYDDRIQQARYEGVIGALKEAGHDVSVDQMARAYADSARYLDERWATDRDMDTEEQVEVLLRCLGIDPEPGLVSSVADPYANAVLHVQPFVVGGAIEALEAVRDSGLRLALISNTGRTPGQAMRKVMRKFGLLDFFEVTTFSNESGYLKPHPMIFEQTLSRIGAKPDCTVHVGDHDVLDVKGAKGYGMKSIKVSQYAMHAQVACEKPDVCIETMYELPDAILRLM
jgi:HAD superfamily hydrolase (TIGR01509 family)